MPGLWQLELGGLTVGPGTPYDLQSVVGLLGPPPVRADDLDRGGRDGVHVGFDVWDARTVEVTIEHVAATQAAWLTQAAALAHACRRTHGSELRLLRWRLPGQTIRRMDVRPRRAAFSPVTADTNGHAGTAVVQLLAPDPQHLADVVTTSTWTIPDGATSAQQTVTAGGNGQAAPVVTVGGPARNPRITNSTVGRALRVDVDIPTGQQLVIDTAARTVRLNGQDVYSAVRTDNQWWLLAPGPNVLVAARSSQALTGASSTIQVARRDAWVG